MDGSSQIASLPVSFEERLRERRAGARPLRPDTSSNHASDSLVAALQTALVPVALLPDFDAASTVSSAACFNGMLLVCGFAIAAIHWSGSWAAGGLRAAGEELVRRTLHVAALVFLVTIAATLAGFTAETSRALATFLLLMAIACAGIGFSTVLHVLNGRRPASCVMIFGQGKTALDLSHQVKQQLPQVKVCIWPTAAIPWPVADIASPSPRYLHPALVELAPDVALISSSAGTDREVALLAMHLAPFDIDVLVDAPRRGQHTTGEVLTFAGLSCVRLFPKPLKRHQRLVKRAFDIVVGLILLLLLLPLLAVIALLVKIDSRGPILFRQPRVGEHGAHFTIWKFRTMHDNAADKFARNATVINDPRLTRIGAVLRKTSLDELPQLVNVLLGSMSLVGPRPHAMNGDNFSSVMANYAARHRVKPGITGLAQVRGWRGPTDTSVQIEQRVANDLRYIGEWSLNNDVAIIARTFFALCGKNAF